MSRKAWFAWVVVLLLLILSLVANYVLYHRAIDYYHDAEAVRLDPAGRRHFAELDEQLQQPAAGQQRVVLLGDSRIEQWNPLPAAEGAQFVNRGRGGDTTEQVRLRLPRPSLRGSPNVVVLQAGINDLKAIGSFPQRDAEIVEDCAANLEEIVGALRSENIQVVVLTIFPVGPIELARWPLWSDATLDAVRRVNERLRALQGKGVRVVDCDAVFAVDGRMNSAYAIDAFHIRPAGYEALNKAVAPALKAAREDAQR